MRSKLKRNEHQRRLNPNKLVHLLLIGIVLSVAGCELFDADKLLKTVEKLDQMSNKVDTIGAKLTGGMIQGMRDSLTAEKTKRSLDSLVSMLSSTAVRSIIDTLTSNRSRAELDSLIGSILALSRDTLTSAYTTEKMNRMIDKIGHTLQTRFNSVRDSLLGDVTRQRLQAMVSQLLGPATRTALDSIIAHGIKGFARGYQSDISPLVDKEATALGKQASKLLWTAGGVIALLLVLGGLLFVKNKRHRQIAEMLTLQIHRVGDEKTYDELVKGIQNRAQELKLEPYLRNILERQGINE